MKITYRRSQEAWDNYQQTILDLIERYNCNRLCEIGGGANPALPMEYISSHGLSYTLLDISREELDKAPDGYEKMVADICDPQLQFEHQFDFMFSKMLAEHVPDGRRFHENVFRLLSPGGIAFHFSPTLFAFPFVVNLLIPDWLSAGLLNLFSPRDKVREGKFPARYSWCRGPTSKHLQRFTDLGYDIDEVRGFYGHEDYYKKIPPLKAVHRMLVSRNLKKPNPITTSYVYLILRKPVSASVMA